MRRPAWHVALTATAGGLSSGGAVDFLVFVLSADLAAAVIVFIAPSSEAALLAGDIFGYWKADIRKGEEVDEVLADVDRR